MTAVVVLGVIALVGAIVAWVTWRRGADERQSVQHHQHTLETLRHVADRRQPTRMAGPSPHGHRWRRLTAAGACGGAPTAPRHHAADPGPGEAPAPRGAAAPWHGRPAGPVETTAAPRRRLRPRAPRDAVPTAAERVGQGRAARG